MSYGKRRVALWLSILTLFTTIFCMVPQSEVQAATTVSFNSFTYTAESNFQIALGTENLYIGDYFSMVSYGSNWSNYEWYSYVSNASKVTYKSSNTKVLKVDAKGKVTTVKAGKAVIAMKYKGKTKKVNITVLSKKNVPSTMDVSASVKASKKMIAAYGNGLTTKNRYQVLTAYNSFVQSTPATPYVLTYENGKRTEYLYVVEIVRAKALCQAVRDYSEKLNPFSTRENKYFNIRSLSGTGKTITATLAKNVTEDQIYGVQYAAKTKGTVKNSNSTSFSISVYCSSNGKTYPATATVKKGSKKMTIKLKTAMTKNTSYKLTTSSDWRVWGAAWLEESKNSFTAK